MKSKFLNLVLSLVLLTLIVGIIFFGKYIFNVFFEGGSDPIIYKVDKILTEEPDDTNNMTSKETSASIGQLISSNETQINNTISTSGDRNFKFFYNQLTSTQKTIYDGLQNNKDNLKQGNYVINYKDAFSELLSQENGADILGDDYQSAIEAFTHDNPDIFYLDVNKMYLNIETTTKMFKTKYNVFISAANESNYLSSEFQSTAEIEKAIIEIEQIKNRIISNLKGTDYQNILYLHDYLIDNIEYDSSYEQTGTYSIYGALIGKKCVCEGYAKAFKYLANCAGYECELMQGIATNSSGQSENHAWNCVKLNNIWYEVDATWDDPIVIGGNGKATNEMKYKYFLKGTNSFEKDHSLEYQFSEQGRKFAYPTISSKDY